MHKLYTISLTYNTHAASSTLCKLKTHATKYSICKTNKTMERVILVIMWLIIYPYLQIYLNNILKFIEYLLALFYYNYML